MRYTLLFALFALTASLVWFLAERNSISVPLEAGAGIEEQDRRSRKEGPSGGEEAVPIVEDAERVAINSKLELLAKRDEKPITGRVVDDSGANISVFEIYADFKLKGKGAKWESRDLGAFRNGVFELAGLEEGHWRIHAKAAGFLPGKPKRLIAPSRGKNLLFRLSRAAELDGVLLEPSGLVANGGEVIVQFQNTSKRVPVGIDGSFAMMVEPGSVSCTGVHPEYAASEQWTEQLKAGDHASLKLTLTHGGQLTGVVQDEAGGPLEGYRVKATGISYEQNTHEKISDAQGTFYFDRLTPGTFSIRAEPEKAKIKAGVIRGAAEVVAGQVTEVLIGGVRTNAKVLTGTLYVDGKPASGIGLWGGIDNSTQYTKSKGAVSDDQGRYSIEFVEPGTGHILVILGNWKFALVPLVVGEEPVQEYDIHTPTGSISGVVLSDGEPPRRAMTIKCSPQGLAPSLTRSMQRQLKCESDGSFLFDYLAPGQYRVELSGRTNLGSAQEDIVVNEDEQVLNVNLKENGGGRIAVRVVDIENRPVKGAMLYVLDSSGYVHHTLGGTKTNADGIRRLRKLGLDRYRFMARTSDAISGYSDWVTVDADRDQQLELTLETGGNVLWDYAAEPRSGLARIWVLDGNGLDFSRTLQALNVGEYLNDGEGATNRSAGPLPPGPYQFRIRLLDGTHHSGSVSVSRGATKDLMLELEG